MRRLLVLVVAAAFVVPIVVVSVFGQAVGSWFLTDPVGSLEQSLIGAAAFILPAALLGLVAGAALGRRGMCVLLVPLGWVVFVVLNRAHGGAQWLDPALAPYLAACAAPYAIGWWVGWAIRVRGAAAGLKRGLPGGPTWTSPDVQRPG